MHFVSSQSERDQIADIVDFLNENMRLSIQEDKTTPAFDNFEDKMKALEKNRDYKGILNYLLSLKHELLSLPTSHKSSALTIQRAILLVLPLLKTQEKLALKDNACYKNLKGTTLQFCTLIEESNYPLSIKVNS